MEHVRNLALKRSVTWIRIGVSGLLVALGLLVPRLGLPQLITGPLVNAVLIIAVEIVGVVPALLVGMVTPLSALGSGVLPLPLLAMVPFIALGNAVLVSVYAVLRYRNNWLALVVGTVAKTAWLWAAVAVLVLRPLTVAIGGFMQQVVLPGTLVQMMQWPQLVTALAGGLIARGVLKGLRRFVL